MITLTGLLLIPLGFLLILQPWRIVLIALPAFALLQGAAVVNIGPVGLQPGYFLGLLVIGRTLFEIFLLRQPLNGVVLTRLTPLGLLFVVSVLTLWTAVAAFDGKVMVLGGTDGYDLKLAAPYSFRRENLTQLGYFAINLLLVFSLAHQAARMPRYLVLRVVDTGIIIAICISIFVCSWQILSYYAGIYFSDSFFFSNVGYLRADHQSFFGYLRLNGPFSEPSALAYFFSAFLFYGWQRFRLRPTPASMGLVIASAAALFLAFSTTGFVALLVFAGLLAKHGLRGLRRWTGRLVVTWWRFLSGMLVLLGATTAAVLLVNNWSAINTILEVALFEKDQSSSFEVRSGADLMALDVIAQTYGIGLGLGSHKPNSLILTLLSNVGIIGMLLFAAFVVDVLHPRTMAEAPPAERALNDTPLRFFLLALLMVHAISNPNFNVVILWVAFGLMTGYVGSLETTKRASLRYKGVLSEQPAQQHTTG